MRIAAGVLLIIAAIANGLGGVKYGGAGAIGTAGAMGIQEAGKAEGANEEQIKKAVEQAKKMAEEAQKKAEASNSAEDKAKAEAAAIGLLVIEKGPMIAAFGIFLFILLGLQIAAAVTLFMQKAAKFVMVVAVLGLLAEIIGFTLFAPLGSLGLFAALGMVASILAFLSAKGYAGGGAAAA